MAWLRIALVVAYARALRAPAAPRVRGPAARRAATTECDAVVVGCGPAGLAAAVELRARGFARVVAVDRRGAPNEFEPQKAYLYLLDARGQRWTDARNATFVHGETGHIACCLLCARALQARGDSCPVCRLPVDVVIQHFFA